ncbi:MAG: alpha/beta fold hydrolase [Bacteroidia bacterium]
MKLHFRKIGNGQPLIILHGLFGSSDNWQTLGKKFASTDFSVYLVDLRNHGHSPHSSEHNYKVMSEDILEIINDENISPVSIIGHSMGGKTAMQLALDHPEKISNLIVVDIAPKKYPSHNSEIVKALLTVDFEKTKTRKEVEKILSEKINDYGSLQLLLKGLYWKENNQLDWRFNLKAIHTNLEIMNEEVSGYDSFKKPTLFIRGEKSNYILDDDILLIKKYFPAAEIKTTPVAGHWVHADNPQWFLETVISFLK